MCPETYEEEENRIIQRQDKWVDVQMTIEAILIGSIGNFLYPLFLLPLCFYYDILHDPFRSTCPLPLSFLVGILHFLESLGKVILVLMPNMLQSL